MKWIQFVSVLSLTVCMVSANDYGTNGQTKSSFPSDSSQSNQGRGAVHRFTGGWNGGVIPAAIQTRHNIEVRPVNLPSEPIVPVVVLVDAGMIPLTILFRSMSSSLNVMQQHVSANVGEEQRTTSEDEPHRLIHEVNKPIIQEVREVISPYRKVIQEIQPVQEEIHTIVARGQERAQSGGVVGTQSNNNYGSSGTSLSESGRQSSSFPISQQPITSDFGSSFAPQTSLINTGIDAVGTQHNNGFNQGGSGFGTGSTSSFDQFNDNFMQNRFGSNTHYEPQRTFSWPSQVSAPVQKSTDFKWSDSSFKKSMTATIGQTYNKKTNEVKSSGNGLSTITMMDNGNGNGGQTITIDQPKDKSEKPIVVQFPKKAISSSIESTSNKIKDLKPSPKVDNKGGVKGGKIESNKNLNSPAKNARRKSLAKKMPKRNGP